MVSERDVAAAIGSTAYGSDGTSVGTVETFYTDDRTGATSWVSISSGLLGRRQVLAPAGDATFADGRLQLTVPADAVGRAPRLGGEHISPEDEQALRQHYADATSTGAGSGDVVTADERTTDEHTTAERTTAERTTEMPGRPVVPPAGDEPAGPPTATGDDSSGRHAAGRGDGSMVRSEEQLHVGTEQVRARRVRVVKYVVTEEVQVTVPIRREEIRIEELPADDTRAGDQLVTEGDPLGGPGDRTGDRTDGGTVPAAALTDGLPDELVLHAERPVVTVEVVPVERVRLRTELVTGEESVTGAVQREQIAVDEDPAPRPG